GGQATIPAALFALECDGERLQAGHGRHFLDTVDQERSTSAAQKEDQSSRLRLQAEMQSSGDDVKGAIPAADAVTDFADGAIAKLLCHTGDVVDTAHFLNGSGRNRKGLAANTKKNDLFRARLRRVGDGTGLHQRTPARVARLSARTRFSTAA